jgi:hypothetical protein
MSRKLLLTIILAFLTFVVRAQESPDTLARTVSKLKQDLDILKRIKISGYIQAQFQYADSSGQPSFNGGNFAPGVDKRFMLRRGRLKVQYDSPLNKKGWSTSQYVLQMDLTEKGASLKDAWVKITDPWSGWVSLTTGVQNRNFGYEVVYSSSSRESPERGRMSQLLFPNERDLGALLTIQGPHDSKWNILKLEAGFFNGTGGLSSGLDVSDFDKKKDFIGRLSVTNPSSSKKIKYGAGISVYEGGYRIDSVNTFVLGSDLDGIKGFNISSNASDNFSLGIGTRNFTKRRYLGADAQFTTEWKAGSTTLKAEYIMGDQPGFSSDTKSPNDKNPITKDIYNREFNGAYFYLIHNILKSPWQVIVKYDWYDPNTALEGNEIGRSVSGGLKATNATDLRYDTWGFGLAYRWDQNVKITAYYDLVENETSTNVSGFTKDRNDNVFTLRMQVKF